MIKLFISFFSCMLCLCSYWICGWIYPKALEFPKIKINGLWTDNPNFNQEDVEKFTDLRYGGYSFLCMLCFILSKLQTSTNVLIAKSTRFFINLGIGFCIASLVDRYCFDITNFTNEDRYMIALDIFICAVDIYIINQKVETT